MWLLCLLSTLSAAAYTDHRYTKVDSVEALLNSKTPPKGNDLMSCYMELIRGYLGKDTRMHNDYCRKALAQQECQRESSLSPRITILRAGPMEGSRAILQMGFIPDRLDGQ